MDAFKTGEIQRMEQGGNDPWKQFFDNHPITQSEGRTFEDSTIKERYEGEVGEEWKERLSAKVEGREYIPGQRPPPQQQQVKKTAEQGPTSRSSTPRLANTRGSSPATSSLEGLEGAGSTKKERNEMYFSKLGTENATRSDALPPSQGGKFTGFGGGLPPSPPGAGSRSSMAGGGVPGLDDFQKDPMGTLTKGFGWFTSTVGKSAKTVNDSYIQPTAKQVCSSSLLMFMAAYLLIHTQIAESDLAAQARVQATYLGQNVQTGARGAADSFNRFVEGPDEHSSAASRRRVEPERKDFWDDFSSLASQNASGGSRHGRSGSRSNAIGTAAMKPGPTTGGTTGSAGAGAGAGTGGGGAASSSSTAAGGGGKQEDGWDDDW